MRASNCDAALFRFFAWAESRMISTTGEYNKRLYVGGLPEIINQKDLEELFSRLVKVREAEIINDAYGRCKGFGYVTVRGTSDDIKRCTSLYQGSVWKGSAKLRIEAAKENFKKRLARENKVRPKEPKRRIRMAKDLTPVNDNNIENKNGWKRSRYGRAVAVIKTRNPSGKLITIDPSSYKNCIEKLFGSIIPKPLAKLATPWEKEESKQQKDMNISSLFTDSSAFRLSKNIEEEVLPDACEEKLIERASSSNNMLESFNFSFLFGPKTLSLGNASKIKLPRKFSTWRNKNTADVSDYRIKSRAISKQHRRQAKIIKHTTK